MKINATYRQYKRLRIERLIAPLDVMQALFWPLRDENWPCALLPFAVLFGVINTGKWFHLPALIWSALWVLNLAVVILASGYYWQMMGVWTTDGLKTQALPWPYAPAAFKACVVSGLKVTLFAVMFLLPLRLWELMLGAIRLPFSGLDDWLVQLAHVVYIFLTPYALTAIVTASRTQRLSDLFDSTRVMPLYKAYYKTALKAVLLGGLLMAASLPVFMFCLCCGPLLGVIPAFWLGFGAHLATQAFAPLNKSPGSS